MEVKKPCQICKTEIGIANCKKCGRFVCERHYKFYNGLCTECLKKI